MTTVFELNRSGDTEYAEGGLARTRVYGIQGTYDADAAEAALLATAPATILSGALFRKSYRIFPQRGDCWEAEVRYSINKRQEQSDSVKWSFETSGGTAHAQQSISTIEAYMAAGYAETDFHGAIGVTKDSVEGCDITVPVLQLRGTIILPAASVAIGNIAAWSYLTGRTNNATWKGFNAGEVLSLGAAGQERGEDDWEVSFVFACGPNLTDLTVGSITGIAKKAWEYLWVRYELDDAGAGKFMVQKPVQVNVEQVYFPGDFSGFPI